jgi:hypothetical protein
MRLIPLRMPSVCQGSWGRRAPAGLDVISMDGYCVGNESNPQCPPAREAEMMRGLYEKWLIPKLGAQQKLGAHPIQRIIALRSIRLAAAFIMRP